MLKKFFVLLLLSSSLTLGPANRAQACGPHGCGLGFGFRARFARCHRFRRCCYGGCYSGGCFGGGSFTSVSVVVGGGGLFGGGCFGRGFGC